MRIDRRSLGQESQSIPLWYFLFFVRKILKSQKKNFVDFPLKLWWLPIGTMASILLAMITDYSLIEGRDKGNYMQGKTITIEL